MKRAAIQGRFKTIKGNFIFISQEQYSYAYPLSEIIEIRCSAWGSKKINYNDSFEKIFNGKRVKLIFKEDSNEKN